MSSPSFNPLFGSKKPANIEATLAAQKKFEAQQAAKDLQLELDLVLEKFLWCYQSARELAATAPPVISKQENIYKIVFPPNGRVFDAMFAGGTRFVNDQGQLHRDDGPAVIEEKGDQHWFVNGEHHREGAPATVYANGSVAWYKNGFLHKEDGPAVVLSETASMGPSHYWALNGTHYYKKRHFKKALKGLHIYE